MILIPLFIMYLTHIYDLDTLYRKLKLRGFLEVLVLEKFQSFASLNTGIMEINNNSRNSLRTGFNDLKFAVTA